MLLARGRVAIQTVRRLAVLSTVHDAIIEHQLFIMKPQASLSSPEFLCVPTSLKTTIFRKRTGNELTVQRSQALVTSQHRETVIVPLHRQAKPDQM